MRQRLSERLVALAVAEPEATEGLIGDLREERARAGRTEALWRAGFLIEILKEPGPPDDAVAGHQESVR